MSLASWIGKRIGLRGDSAGFWSSYVGGDNWAGEPVNPANVNQIGAVYRGSALWGGTIGALPLKVYRRTASGESVVDEDSEYTEVLSYSPNADQTPLEFIEGLVASEVLVGNGYARIRRTGERLTALQPIDAAQCVPKRRRETNQLYYEVTDWRGMQTEVPPEEIFHLKGFSYGADAGMSVVEFGRQTMSSTRAADKTAGKFFKSGLSSSGFLETGQVLQEPDRNRLQATLDAYRGSENAGKLMILEGGMTYKSLSISPQDAQLLLARGFNIEEIARWLGMPPILLGHNASGQTMWGTGLEAIIRAWYQLGLGQKITRLEKAIQKRLIRPADQRRYYVKFNVDALLRGDSAAQAVLFAAAVQNGWMTRAEVRALLELKYIPGSDELTAQVNLVPVQMLGDNAQQAHQVEAVRQSLIEMLHRLGGPAHELAERIAARPALPAPPEG